MPCPYCNTDHTSVACPANVGGPGSMGADQWPHPAPTFNWFPVDYTQKLDRIIELLEKLVDDDAPDGFICPDCGGTHFGTQDAHDWEVAIGECHGSGDGVGCGFRWGRIDDEKLGFKL